MSSELEYTLVHEQIGHLLSSSSELAKNILKRLGCYDLTAATQVCHLWFLVGNSILKKERRIRFITIHPANAPTTDLKVALDVVPQQNVVLDSFLEQLPINASTCIGFASGEWLFRKDVETKYNINGSSLSEMLKQVLPPECQVALISGRGVIGTVENSLQGNLFLNLKSENLSNRIKNIILPFIDDKIFTQDDVGENSGEDNSALMIVTDQEMQSTTEENNSVKSISDVGYSIEIENMSGGMEALSLLLIPNQPGVKFNVIHCLQQEFINTFRKKGEKMIESPITTEEFNTICGLSPEEDLKGFLVFDYDFTNLAKLLISAALTRQNDRVAIGGGLVEVVQQKGERLRGTMAIVISGDNVKVSTFVLPTSVKDAKSLEYWLTQLKKFNMPERHSFCFLFSCCGRGSYWYSHNNPIQSDEFFNVESRIFRKLFPNTPLFGFFGDGEIGINHNAVHLNASHTNKRRKGSKKMYHQYTSVFVFVSIL